MNDDPPSFTSEKLDTRIKALEPELPELFSSLITKQEADYKLFKLFSEEKLFYRQQNIRSDKELLLNKALYDLSALLEAKATFEDEGEFRDCYSFEDQGLVVKIPQLNKYEPLGAFGSQYVEAAALDLGFQDKVFGISIAPGRVAFSQTGIPIILMESVETKITLPEWVRAAQEKCDPELREKYHSLPGYDPELHSQVGYSNILKDWVFYDLGCLPKDPDFDVRLQEFSQSKYYWNPDLLRHIASVQARIE